MLRSLYTDVGAPKPGFVVPATSPANYQAQSEYRCRIATASGTMTPVDVICSDVTLVVICYSASRRLHRVWLGASRRSHLNPISVKDMAISGRNPLPASYNVLAAHRSQNCGCTIQDNIANFVVAVSRLRG